VRVFFGDGQRGFARSNLFTAPESEGVGNSYWFDVDNDRDQDLLTRSAGLRATAVRINSARYGAMPSLGDPIRLEPLTSGFDRHIALHLLGRDAEGRAQFLEYDTPDDPQTALVRVTLDRAGTRVAARERMPALLGAREWLHSVSADFDHDGRADMVIAGEGAPGIPGRTPFAIARQNADGSFTRCGGFEFTSAIDVHGQAGAGAFGDFDGDGMMDAAGASACGYCPSMLHVFLRR